MVIRKPQLRTRTKLKSIVSGLTLGLLYGCSPATKLDQSVLEAKAPAPQLIDMVPGFGVIGSLETDKQVLKDAGLEHWEGSDEEFIKRVREQANSYRKIADPFLLSAEESEKVRDAYNQGGTLDITAQLRRIAVRGGAAETVDPWQGAVAHKNRALAATRGYMAALDILSQLGVDTSQEYSQALLRANATGATIHIGAQQRGQQQWLAELKGADENAEIRTLFRAPKFSAYGAILCDGVEGKPASVSTKSDADHYSTVLHAEGLEEQRVARLVIERAEGKIRVRDGWMKDFGLKDGNYAPSSFTTKESESMKFASVKGQVLVSDMDAVGYLSRGIKPEHLVGDRDEGGRSAIVNYRKMDHPEQKMAMASVDKGLLEAHDRVAREAEISHLLQHGSESPLGQKIPGKPGDPSSRGGGVAAANLLIGSDGKAEAFGAAATAEERFRVLRTYTGDESSLTYLPVVDSRRLHPGARTPPGWGGWGQGHVYGKSSGQRVSLFPSQHESTEMEFDSNAGSPRSSTGFLSPRRGGLPPVHTAQDSANPQPPNLGSRPRAPTLRRKVPPPLEVPPTAKARVKYGPPRPP